MRLWLLGNLSHASVLRQADKMLHLLRPQQLRHGPRLRPPADIAWIQSRPAREVLPLRRRFLPLSAPRLTARHSGSRHLLWPCQCSLLRDEDKRRSTASTQRPTGHHLLWPGLERQWRRRDHFSRARFDPNRKETKNLLDSALQPH